MRGPYAVSILLSGNGLFSGSTSAVTSKGKAIFSNMRILSNGFFLVTASASNIIPAEYSQLTIKNLVYSIDISVNNSTVVSGLFFNITAALKSEDTTIYTNPSNVSLSTNTSDINGNLLIKTTTGIAVFSIYFEVNGYKLITITSGTISTTIVINVITSINPDPMCVYPLSNITCGQCVKNAEIVENTCQCIYNSQFSNITKICECITGYSLVNGFCVICENYFSLNEITGYYSSDYKTIILSFARQVDGISTLKSCSDILTLPDNISALDPVCVWSNSISLSIIFELIPPIHGIIIIVNPYKVLAKGNNCTTDIQELVVLIENNNPIPIPAATINSPDTFSLTCNTGNLLISTSISETNLTLNWTASIFPSNPSLELWISTLSTSLIEISPSVLLPCTMIVTLNVSNLIFNTSDAISKTITITNDNTIQVSFNTGNSISIASTQSLIISTIVYSCNSTSYSYTWSCLSPSNFDFTSLFNASINLYTLTIPSNSLKAGQSYAFHVKVSDGNSVGSGNVNVVVAYSKLIINLSRSSGEFSSFLDFEVYANVTDPDNSQIEISYLWCCYEDNNVCTDALGYYLLGITNQNILTVPAGKLQIDSVYIITLNASTSSKSLSKSIEITIISANIGDIQLTLQETTINCKSINYIKPIISSNYPLDFIWTLTSSSLSFTKATTYSYLIIPAGSLIEGKTYNLNLTVSYVNTSISSSTTITCNSPPSCSKINATNTNNLWSINLIDCIDTDSSSSSSLIYQYSVINTEGRQYWITLSTYSQYIITMLPANSAMIIGRVCDISNECNNYNISINNHTQRALSPLTEFKNNIINQDNTPAAIIYYSYFITDYPTLEYIYNVFYNFFSTTYMDGYKFDTFLSCLDAIFIRYSVNTTMLITNATEFVTKTLIKYNQTISINQGEEILKVFSPYVEVIDLNVIKLLIDSISNYLINNAFPGSKIIIIDQGIALIRYRLHKDDLNNINIKQGNISLQTPSDLGLNNDSIYDIYYYQYRLNSSDISNLQIYTSGYYINYSLSLYSPIGFYTVFKDSIILSLSYAINSNLIECIPYTSMNWTYKACEIIEKNNNKASISIYYPSLITIQSSNNDIFLSTLSYYILDGYILLLMICWISYLIKNKNNQQEIQSKKTFILLYPLTSLMINQDNSWRFLMMNQLCTSNLFLMALIGGCYNYFFNFSIGYQGFLLQLIPLAILQIITISILLINFEYLKHPKVYFYSIGLCLIFSVISLCAILFISFQATNDIGLEWLISFIVLMVVEMFILLPFYSFILSKRNQIKFTAIAPLPYDAIVVRDLEDSNIQDKSMINDETVIMENSPVKVESRKTDNNITYRPVGTFDEEKKQKNTANKRFKTLNN